MKRKLIYATFCILLVSLHASAQLSLTGQLRTRTEFRNGQGAPLPEGAKPSFFTSQRTRVSLGYTYNRLKFNVTAQDVRVWGQDVSTINRITTADNNGLMLHEAWAEILLSDTSLKNKALSLKIGRQELVYDDQRLLGNLDWLQHARRHDAALLKWETNKILLHAGAAFNQNKELGSTTTYSTVSQGNYPSNTNGGAMYKSMQFVYAGEKWATGNASFLFLADQFSKYSTDSLNVKTFQPGAVSRATTGFYINNSWKKLAVTASAYYQFGKTSALQKVNGYLLSASAQYAFSKKASVTAGTDYTSGGLNGNTSKAFDPLYGTPHKFWGLMDYFYVASPFGRGGLQDYYLKAKYKPSDKVTLGADLHQFSSATDVEVNNHTKRSLGQELDLLGTYTLNKHISFEGGYSHFFPTAALTAPSVKNIVNAKNGADWAYLMVIIKPDFLSK